MGECYEYSYQAIKDWHACHHAGTAFCHFFQTVLIAGEGIVALAIPYTDLEIKDMKTKTIIAVTTLIASSALAQAADKGADKKTHQQENIHSEQDQAAPAENLRMGMPMMAMHEHMKKMQVQMDEVHHSKDPDKRDELLDEHRSSMHNMMKMMQGMQAGQSMNRPCDMMGKGMGKQGMSGGGMMGDQQGDNISMPQGGMMGMPMMEMMHRQRMMGQRMDMMQMMMDQMMQNQMATEETRMMRKRGMGMSK